jgi:hypothetical protein
MKKVCLEKILGCSIPLFLFKLTRKKHFKYARLWNGALRIMQNRGNNAKASWFHQKMALGLGKNTDKMIETWNPGDKILAGSQGNEICNQSPLGRVATPEEIAHTVLFLAAPGSEWLTGGVVDLNGASYFR